MNIKHQFFTVWTLRERGINPLAMEWDSIKNRPTHSKNGCVLVGNYNFQVKVVHKSN